LPPRRKRARLTKPTGARAARSADSAAMPTLIRIEPDTGLRITTAIGVVRGDDILRLAALIAADPALSEANRALVDLRSVNLSEFSAADLSRVSELPTLPREAGSRTAIVAEAPDVYDVAKAFCTLREARGIGAMRVFRSEEEARGWLFVEHESLHE
jgi:hypothetical protein